MIDFEKELADMQEAREKVHREEQIRKRLLQYIEEGICKVCRLGRKNDELRNYLMQKYSVSSDGSCAEGGLEAYSRYQSLYTFIEGQLYGKQ